MEDFAAQLLWDDKPGLGPYAVMGAEGRLGGKRYRVIAQRTEPSAKRGGGARQLGRHFA
jgi:hypothetical protein